ncbi:hypothetical protein [Streptomyces sp. NPDC127098]|uniref:hypothetical protein n=1 Tax=Streptomyces sp. NPDC127098 TaxID=3347137 RepID=UPI00365FD8FC
MQSEQSSTGPDRGAVPDVTAVEPKPDDGITIVTGLERAVDLAEPVTCLYCGSHILRNDDHMVDCSWRPGKAAL